MDFKRFTSEEGDFSILMPGVPQGRLLNPKTISGTSQTHMLYSAHLVNPFSQKIFAVAYADLPEDLIKNQTLAERLDDKVKSLFLYQKGKLIGQKEIMFVGHHGREVRYEMAVPLFQNMQCVSRIFEARGRVYNLAYTEHCRFLSPRKMDLDMAYKFFDSFDLLTPKKST